MANAFVVLNAGSTSVKFAAYTGDDPHSLDLVCRGQLDGIGSQPSFAAKNSKGEVIETHTWNLSIGRRHSNSSSPGSSATKRASRSLRWATASCWVGSLTSGPLSSTKKCSESSKNSYRSCRCTSHSSWTPSARWQKHIPGSRRSRCSTRPFIGQCPRSHNGTPCPQRCLATRFGTGAITEFPTTTSLARFRATLPRHEG